MSKLPASVRWNRARHPFVSLIAISLLLAASCERDRTRRPSTPAPPIALGAPIEFTVTQRSTAKLPGAGGRIVLNTGDITAGQVAASLAWRDGEPIADARSMRTGDVLSFSVEGHGYQLKLTRLTNTLMGDDTAAFELASVAGAAGAVLTEDQKIQALIDRLGKLEGATFIRNGEEHSASEAVSHMQRKWTWKKDDIKTARDFISKIASASSTTGEPYVIRDATGKQQPAGEWFQEQLEAVERVD